MIARQHELVQPNGLQVTETRCERAQINRRACAQNPEHTERHTLCATSQRYGHCSREKVPTFTRCCLMIHIPVSWSYCSFPSVKPWGPRTYHSTPATICSWKTPVAIGSSCFHPCAPRWSTVAGARARKRQSNRSGRWLAKQCGSTKLNTPIVIVHPG